MYLLSYEAGSGPTNIEMTSAPYICILKEQKFTHTHDWVL